MHLRLASDRQCILPCGEGGLRQRLRGDSGVLHLSKQMRVGLAYEQRFVTLF